MGSERREHSWEAGNSQSHAPSEGLRACAGHIIFACARFVCVLGSRQVVFRMEPAPVGVRVRRFNPCDTKVGGIRE